jgi:hypothetical protein
MEDILKEMILIHLQISTAILKFMKKVDMCQEEVPTDSMV